MKNLHNLFDSTNALNGWTQIQWKSNPPIIQDILGVTILGVDETTVRQAKPGRLGGGGNISEISH